MYNTVMYWTLQASYDTYTFDNTYPCKKDLPIFFFFIITYHSYITQTKTTYGKTKPCKVPTKNNIRNKLSLTGTAEKQNHAKYQLKVPLLTKKNRINVFDTLQLITNYKHW